MSRLVTEIFRTSAQAGTAKVLWVNSTRPYQVLDANGKPAMYSPVPEGARCPLNGNRIVVPINGERREVSDKDILAALSTPKGQRLRMEVKGEMFELRRRISQGEQLNGTDILHLGSIIEYCMPKQK